jgi:hypothetical protein
MARVYDSMREGEGKEVARGEDEDGSRGEDASRWQQSSKAWAGLAGEEVDDGRTW